MQDAVDTLKAEVSLGRFGQPVRLAPVYVFLASREVRYVTGEVHGATGGNGSA
jgi:NAD(P)-dependent dehydrogenase (short-subunit alcohol dehydrogenase family)